MVAKGETQSVSGKVRDVQGNSVAGAKVTLTIPGDVKPVAVTTTAQDGTYQFRGLRTTAYFVFAERPGFLPSDRRRVDLLSSSAVTDLTLATLASPGLQSGPPRFSSVGTRGNVDAGGYSTPAAAKVSGDLIQGITGLEKGKTAGDPLSQTHVLAAQCEERRGEFANAAHEYELAVSLNPSEDNLFSEGYEMILARQYTAAIRLLQGASQRYPQSVKLEMCLGAARFLNGESSKAIEVFLRSADLNPQERLPYLFLGKTAAAAVADLSERVRATLKRWAAAHPDDPDADYYYALSLQQVSRGAGGDGSNETELLLKKAIRLDPQLTEAHEQLGSVYGNRGQYEEAILEYRRALAIAPDLTRVHYRLAQAYAKIGARDLAALEFEQFQHLHDSEKASAGESGNPLKQALSALTEQRAGDDPSRSACKAVDVHEK